MGVGYIRKMTHNSNQWALNSKKRLWLYNTAAILPSHSNDLWVRFPPYIMASFVTVWAITADSIRNKQREAWVLSQAQLFWALDLYCCEIFPQDNPKGASKFWHSRSLLLLITLQLLKTWDTQSPIHLFPKSPIWSKDSELPYLLNECSPRWVLWIFLRHRKILDASLP